MNLRRLQRHIGVSPTALRSLRAQMESVIIDYQKQQHELIRDISSNVEVCAAADETFFDQVILVMLDLPSGYIFVEERTENCQYETWQQRVSLALKPLGLKVKYLVSDRAKAIVKLALHDLGANSIADLFHVLYDLNRSIAFELNRKESRIHKDIKRAQINQAQPETISQLEGLKQILEQSRFSYDNCCHHLSTCLHPFDINQNTPITAEIVSLRLQEIWYTLETIRTTHKLQDPRSGIRKLKNQIPSLSTIIDIWWSWVANCLALCECEPNVVEWVKEHLLPVVYWQQQVQRTKNPDLRKNYQAAYLRADKLLSQHPVTASLSLSDREHWWNWAMWMVSKFQRSSSAVEGRNGYLSQIHRSQRGLSSKRLQVETVIHNFSITRSDGTTAAQRLFGREFPDLFDYLVEHIGELPQPRKSRKSSQPEIFTLPTVPS